jgi:hypothetical protein
MIIQSNKHDSRQVAEDICMSPATLQEIILSDFGRVKHSMELDLRDVVESLLCLKSNDLFVIFVHPCRIFIRPDGEFRTRGSQAGQRPMIIMDSISLGEGRLL